VRLLKALCGDGEHLWAVGDAKQSIYRFRGASSFNMRRFGAEDFPAGSRRRLKKNYRSTPEIVEPFSLFANGMKPSGPDAALDAVRDASGNRPQLLTVERAEQQPVALANSILEPIFEADFQPGSFGYRPKRTAHDAVDRVARAIVQQKTRIIDIDLRSYFDNVRHDRLLEKVARRVDDVDVLHLLKIMLKANGKQGVPQGGVISPLLSNLYLTEVDRMLERAKETTRFGKYTYIEYARFADDLVILIDAHPRHEWLMGAVERRLREELAELQVEINEEKSRNVDLGRGESFGFLGFDFRRVRSRRGVWCAQYTPKLKKRTALLRKLKDVFRRYQSQPLDRVIKLINPMLRGWVAYFAVGNSSECFGFVKDWVEKKIRRHMARARNRNGFGWKRWSTQWLYESLRLYNGYKVRWCMPKVAPAR
jgi:RNA-directed DNA polymerase